MVNREERFSLLLCIAVWMHLRPSERGIAMRTIHKLLDAQGIAVITLRHPPDPRRGMFDVSLAETIDLATRSGFTLLQASDSDESDHTWQRFDVSWSTVVLRRSDKTDIGVPSRPSSMSSA
jgi:hypothetical protein